MLLAEELNARGLSAITRDERVRAFEQLHLPVAASLSRATVIKVGQLLGASEVIAGSFRLNGDELIVDAHSIRIEVGRLQPQVTERAPAQGLLRASTSASRGACRGAARARAGGGAAAARRLRELHQGPAGRERGDPGDVPRVGDRRIPGFDQARLALWDVSNEQGDHAAALAAVKPVPAASPFARPRAAAHRPLAARIEGLRGRGRGLHPAARSADPEDHRAAARASRAGAQQPRHRPAAARRDGRCRLGDLLF